MAEEDFYLKLVHETMKVQEVRTSFLEEHLRELDVLYFKGCYSSSYQIIRFESLWGLLDFPASLSIFEFKNQNFQSFSKTEDQHFIFSVFSKVWDRKIQKIYMTFNENSYFLIAFKTDENFKEESFLSLLKSDIAA